MPDNLSPEDRAKTMRSVRSKDTQPERRLVAMLAGMQIGGWHRHVEGLPGRPDVAFTTLRVAVFVDGCFWHGCPMCNRPLPETNRSYWQRKIERNIARDKEWVRLLELDGYRVVRVWEHELKTASGREQVRRRIREALSAARGEQEDS